MSQFDESQIAILHDFVSRGLANPKTRKLLKQAERELYPDRAIPEEDAKAEVMDAISKVTARLDAMEEGKVKDRIAAEWERGRALARKNGYNDDGLKALEGLMLDRGIVDYEAGMALFDKLNPPPEPTTAGNGAWNFFEKPNDGPAKEAFDQLLEGHDESFLSTMIPETLRQVRGK